MKYKHILTAACLLCFGTIKAQDSLKTHVTYDMTAEAFAGTGDYNAYQLVTNRHHAVGTRSNTAYLRGAVNIEHTFKKDLVLSGSVDAIASIHADHKVYLQQCYANLSYKSFFIEAGSREQKQVVRDNLLSIGSFVKGTNAKPIPQLQIGTNGFWNLPFTKEWVQANFAGGFGKLLDSDYREKTFYKAPDVNPLYATGLYYHQAHLYFRTNPTKPFFVLVGIEHVAVFGGKSHIYENGVLVTKEKTAKIKDFLNVILPLGDRNYFENGSPEDWSFGNHIGVMTYQFGWNIDKHHQLQVYVDNPFEDGSGVRKSNIGDGLWGIQYSNTLPERQLIRGAVMEYFQSTNQCGPLHWDPNDYPEPIRSQITDKVVGDDNYYNHNFYGSYSYYGMTPGIALITSPIYNKNGDLRFLDNRVKAWHIGINGEITDRLSYLIKGSYREGWGTYTMPLPKRHHSFDAMMQGIYKLGNWEFSGAYAFDKGNIYGDCSTFNLKIGYHGKIL
jgi:hypothetical protein